jgi:HTH-type transcriptional regulator / antitoxin HipB
MTEHPSMDDLRRERMSGPGFDAGEYEAGRAEAILAIELAEAIRERRLELGLTQTQPAERAGLRQPEVSRIESGGGTPTIGMLERLAYALEVRFVARFEKVDAALDYSPWSARRRSEAEKWARRAAPTGAAWARAE